MSLGEDWVGVPADQLDQAAVERLEGVHLVPTDKRELCVLVDLQAARWEASDRIREAKRHLGRPLTVAEDQACHFESFNNRDYWLMEPVTGPDDMIGFTALRVNPLTGRVE